MPALFPYLTFNGNCREAMVFYSECLNAELSLQAIGESPLSGNMPERMKNAVLLAVLRKGELVLMGSDMVGEEGLVRGNAVALMLECSSEEDIRHFYGKLAEKGIAEHPLSPTVRGTLFGQLTDKFGNHWLLNYVNDKQSNKEQSNIEQPNTKQ